MLLHAVMDAYLAFYFMMLGAKGNLYNNTAVRKEFCLEHPKLAPYLQEMRENIANTLGIDISQVSVKATTEEGLGFTGNGEGIACTS